MGALGRPVPYYPTVKRFIQIFPYLGLLVLGLAVAVGSFGSEGLGLLQFSKPPELALASFTPSPHQAAAAGRITSEAGEPIAEVLVMAEVDGQLVWDYSDAEGRFKLTQLPTGPLELTLLRRMMEPQTFQGNVPSTDMEFVMRAPLAPVPTLPAIGQSHMDGEVLNSIPERGLLGYEVQLIPVEAPQVIGAPIPARTRVGADRRFHFDNLMHGQYSVRLLPPWAVGGTWPNLIDTQQAFFEHGPATKNPVFSTACGEISGRLIDREGQEVEGALIRVAPVDRAEHPWAPLPSNDHGQFLVSDLPPGSYRLQIDAGGDEYNQVIEVTRGVTSRVDVRPLEIHRQK
jgi:hypothetical protein